MNNTSKALSSTRLKGDHHYSKMTLKTFMLKLIHHHLLEKGRQVKVKYHSIY
jgi:hypothetical protein